MILSRLGKKTKIAGKIQEYFPIHDIYIEPFFGAGGMFFNKPKSKYNSINDIDDDVFNLYQVVLKNRVELATQLKQMPESQSLFKHWMTNKESDPIKKALRFLFLSNFSLLGAGGCIRNSPATNYKRPILNNIDNTFDFLCNVKIMNMDFIKFIKSVHFREKSDVNRSFFYADPPYLSTRNNYSNGFSLQDTINLFDILIDTGAKFAVSEFDNPDVIEITKSRNLNIIEIGERKNLKNRRTELLITNYNVTSQGKLF